MQSSSTKRLFVIAAIAVIAAAVGFAVTETDAGASTEVESIAVDEPSISCDAQTIVYGDAVTCLATGGTAIEWPDGHRTGLDAYRAPLAVGSLPVTLTDDAGVVLASTTLSVTPDISLECEARDGELKKVFQLAESETRSEGWDYVFTDIVTGDEVAPGDPNHPNGGAEDGLERIVLSEEQSTGLCRLISQAAEDHDGEYQLSVESPWEAPQTPPMRIIGPSSKTQWAGTQPAEVEGIVTVNGLTASERVGVYQSGCS